MALYYVTVEEKSIKRFIVDAESPEEAKEIIEADETEATFDRYLDGGHYEISDVSLIDDDLPG